MTENFGNIKSIKGSGGVYDASIVPLAVLQNIRPRVPYKITISGANQITFTLLASVTHTIPIWNGTDYGQLKENLAYTWQAGALNSILASTGVVTLLQAPIVGVWYYYVGFVSGVPTIYPSQTGPSEVQGPFEGGPLTHPGTTRARVYSYVGFSICSATTPVFVAATKQGYWYNFAAQSEATVSTSWTELAFTGADAMPKLGELGGELKGYVTVGAAGTVTVGSTSTATIGIYKYGGHLTTGSAFYTLPPIPMSDNGKIYAQDITARGAVAITGVKDVV